MYKHQAIKVLTTAALLSTLVTPVQASPLQGTFADIDSSYAKGVIQQLTNAGILEGGVVGRFNPQGRMTRQDFMIILSRALGLDISNLPASPTFTDIPKNHYAYPHIEAAVKAGLISGVGNGKFGGDRYLTRQDMAVLLENALSKEGLSGVDAPPKFTDSGAISSYAKEAVTKAFNHGLIKGDAEGNFRPHDAVDRQSAAIVASRFLKVAPLTIQNVTGDAIYIGGQKYTASEKVKGILNQSNRSILKGAKIRIEAANRQIEKITYLELRSSGKAASAGKAEFSSNLTLNGQQSVIDGTLKIAANYISLKNLSIMGDLEISRALEQDFYSESIEVKGKTLVNGGDSNTVVFKDSALGAVNVNKEDVRVEMLGQAFVHEVNVTSNATLVGGSEALIDQVTVSAGAQKVELQAKVDALQVNAASTITGNASIGTLTVNTSSPVTLSTTGAVTELVVAANASKVTLGASTQVQALTLPAGVTASSVVTNYSQAQSQIGTVSSGQPVLSTGTAPKVTQAISDFTITLGATKEIDLSKVFTDAENNITSYKALLVKAASAPETVTATIDGSILKIEPKLPGKITVRAQAFDLFNNRAFDDFVVTVNRHPVAADIPAQVVTLNGDNKPINLDAYFTDPDSDVLSYTNAVSDHPEVVTVELSGNQLTLTPVAFGTASITVTAQDGKGGTASKTFTIEFNNAPVVDEVLSDKIATIGKVSTVDLSRAFKDQDGDPLTYEAVPNDPQVASATVNGSELQITPIAGQLTTITVTARDGRGGHASQDFAVQLNDAPQVASPVADQVAMINGGTVSVDLATAFTDANGDALNLQAVSSDLAVATASISGRQVLITPVANGITTVTVTADDARGGSVTDTFVVRVNEAPSVGRPISDLKLQWNGNSETLDLSGVFTDANGDSLTLTAAAADTSMATVSMSNGTQLTVTPASYGSTTVTVTANDGYGGTVSSVFNVLVNRKPEEVGSLESQTVTIDAGDKVLDFTGLFADPDGDSWTIEAVSADPTLAGASVTGKQVHLTPVGAGATTVTVTALDGKGGSASRTFAVEVNRAPRVVNAIADKVVTWGDSDLQLDLSSLFGDEDQDSLTLSAESLTPSVASVSMSQEQLTIHPVANGTADIRITAEDGRGGSQSDTFQFRVNRKPQALAIEDYTLSLGSLAKTIDLSAFFTDPDMDLLAFSAVSSDEATASASISGSMLTLAPIALGSTTVSVTSTDGDGASVTESFGVAVQPNQSPTVKSAIADKWIKPAQDTTIDLSSVFHDADGDALEFQAVSADTGTATAALSGNQLTVAGITDGQALITVTAQDIVGNSVQSTFTVTVASNEAPVVAGTIPLQVIGSGVTGNQISIADLFSDPDHDAMTFTATSADAGLAQASISGSTLTISPGSGHGRTTVTVTADDGRGGTATATIDVLAAEVILNKQITAKLGVGEVSMDLSAYFPTQIGLKQYNQNRGEMTPNASQTLGDKKFKMVPGGLGTTGYWVTSEDGKGAYIEVVVQAQQGAHVFFDEYTRGPDGRIALEFYNDSEAVINYTVLGYRYNLKTQQMETMMNREIPPTPYVNVFQIYPGTMGIVINHTFYDLMDITPVQWYHGEFDMTGSTNDYVVCGFELLKDGQVVDRIGDKNWTPASSNQPLPLLGTMIRKKGITTGSTAFQLEGEWDLHPLTYVNLFGRTK